LITTPKAALVTSHSAATATLSVEDTPDNVINSTGSGDTSFTVPRLAANEPATVPSVDSADRTNTSSDSGLDTAIQGKSVALDADKSSGPSLSFNGTDPAHAVFTISGLNGDEHGTVTFTDVSGHQDVVPVQSNGVYSANLSNLTDGEVTYLLSVTDPAGNVTTIDPPVNLGDGSANAPAGTAQFASLLSGYAARPAWNVAGVDYAVGYAAGTALKDPMTGALPAGVTRDSANHIFLITGDNVVISGWDFSKQGGWQVKATNADNPIIENNYFKIGANALQPINLLGVPNGFTGQGGTIRNNVIDGNNVDIGGSALIATSRGGIFVIQYNLLENAGSDLIDAGAETLASGVVTTYDVRYNVMKQGGQQTSAHPDWFQTFANNHYNNITIDYNTVVQTSYPANGGGSQGFTLDGNTNAPLATFDNGSVSNNTVIVTATPIGTTGFIVRLAPDLITGTFTVANNFIDPSGLSNGGINYDVRLAVAGGPYHGKVESFGDVNMVTGAVIAPNGLENNTTAVLNVTANPATGTELPGSTVTLTLNFSALVNVTGTPTLTLNDGGTATYVGGSGTKALSFRYTVGANDSEVSDLAITQVNLPVGASIKDVRRRPANLKNAVTRLKCKN
jgi:hypothetical protein